MISWCTYGRWKNQIKFLPTSAHITDFMKLLAEQDAKKEGTLEKIMALAPLAMPFISPFIEKIMNSGEKQAEIMRMQMERLEDKITEARNAAAQAGQQSDPLEYLISGLAALKHANRELGLLAPGGGGGNTDKANLLESIGNIIPQVSDLIRSFQVEVPIDYSGDEPAPKTNGKKRPRKKAQSVDDLIRSLPGLDDEEAGTRIVAILKSLLANPMMGGQIRKHLTDDDEHNKKVIAGVVSKVLKDYVDEKVLDEDDATRIIALVIQNFDEVKDAL